MSKWRKKPVVVEAIQYDGKNALQVWLWAKNRSSYCVAERANIAGNFLQIDTLEGVMRGDPGDWIICGLKRELYPCKPDIFGASYEAVE